MPVLGDSVFWGEMCAPTGPGRIILDQEAGQDERFLNGGVNGLFPLALEGLVDYYAGGLHGRKVILTAISCG